MSSNHPFASTGSSLSRAGFTRWATLAIAAACALVASASAQAAESGEFAVVTYNVAGLPPLVGPCCDPVNSIPDIASRISPSEWDIVGFQEAFTHGQNNGTTAFGTEFYDALMGPGTPVEYSFPPSDPVTGFVVGSGLGRLSTFPFDSSGSLLSCEEVANDATKYCRQRWDDLSGGVEGLSDKGYSYARHEITDGVFLDVYNMHAHAGQDAEEIAARASNLEQFLAEFNTRSDGTAAIVLGDTNSTYDRSGDVIRDFLTNTIGDGGQDDPLEDVWLELVRHESEPQIPLQGGTALFPCDEAQDPAELPRSEWAGPSCEWRDKIFYRSSDELSLTATAYFVETDFVNDSDIDLSDHYPTGATFSYQVVPEPGGAGVVALVTLALVARRKRLRSLL